MLTILKSHIRPIIEFASPVWATYFIEDLRALESVQRRWTKEVDGLRDSPYDTRLRELDLYSIKGRLLRSDMILCWKIFNSFTSISPNDLFTVDNRPGLRGYRYKIQHRFAYTEARKRFFSVRCAKSWNSLPDAVVSATSIGAFKAGLHRVLGDALFDYEN